MERTVLVAYNLNVETPATRTSYTEPNFVSRMVRSWTTSPSSGSRTGTGVEEDLDIEKH